MVGGGFNGGAYHKADMEYHIITMSADGMVVGRFADFELPISNFLLQTHSERYRLHAHLSTRALPPAARAHPLNLGDTILAGASKVRLEPSPAA